MMLTYLESMAGSDLRQSDFQKRTPERCQQGTPEALAYIWPSELLVKIKSALLLVIGSFQLCLRLLLSATSEITLRSIKICTYNIRPLGPILYAMFVSPLFDLAKMTKFADDNFIIKFNKCITQLIDDMKFT